jgi:Holliday junction DNA helicase RuvA
MRKPTGLIINVNGVGYSIDLPLSTLCRSPQVGEAAALWIHTHVREDVLKLYGFLTYGEKELFEILISVNGIGPKIGLAILSTLEPEQIKMAIIQAMPEIFESVPGIGHRMAEKILVELKSKMKRINEMSLPAASSIELGLVGAFDQQLVKKSQMMSDVQSALENLGFKPQVVAPLLRSLVDKEGEIDDFNSLLRRSLLVLGGADSKDRRPKTMSKIDAKGAEEIF